jgi:ribose transport system ATP-binding protein
MADDSTPGTDVLLRMEGITKRFPGVTALDAVSLECRAGEVLALVGENGAGKSTLMKVLSGAYQPDDGHIVFRGQPVRIATPRQAQQIGIGIIMQELNLLPYLTVEENIWLGREPVSRLGVIDWRTLRTRSLELLESLHVRLRPTDLIADLTVAQRQFVEIAKALSLHADLIIMDEPSSSLTEHELDYLFQVIRDLTRRGVAVVYISHRLNEIFEIADRVTVLKDGKLVGSRRIADVTRTDLVQMMVGRDLAETFPRRSSAPGTAILRVRRLSRRGVLHDISFEVRAGEIVGLAGLVGAGRTELARAIFGADPIDEGAVEVAGKAVKLRSPHDAVRAGIVLIPEDRKLEGLVHILSIRKNIGLPNLDLFRRWGFVRGAAELAASRQWLGQLDVRASGPDQPALSLSGGNQQKVVLAKWLVRHPQLIILDEPTRGIDVGAKAEIYRLMRQLADGGAAILMISSELPEILGMGDRILVMHEGRLTAALDGARATEEAVMAAATGGLAVDGARNMV